jgi:KDO2-lipid IV(A) lauroyltransferase
MFSKIFTYTGIGIIKLVSLLPLPVLQLISDMMYPFVYYVIRYRRKVVAENLSKSFPEKDSAEIQKTEKEYYRYLCDLIVETIKTRSISLNDISRRMAIRNPDLVNSFFREGKSVIVMTLHYGNWEWLIHIAHYLEQHSYIVYKPLQNQIFDRYLNSVRERFGGETISMSLALRKLIEADKNRLPVLTWLAADQAPPWNYPFWTNFLNRETMFFNGPAKLAQYFNQPVIFQQIRRIRRGYYETWFEVLTANPCEMHEKDIITAYVKKAESVIRKDPAYYLWSHRRWKYKKSSGVPFF